MKLRLIKFYDSLTTSFWFLPTVMAIGAVAAALGSTALDNEIGSGWVQDIGWVWSGKTEGARSVLSIIAGSLMTVISIVFSLTITTLAQVSSQFGPRVLRNFTSDRGNQFVLGTFIATFVYSLLVLRTIRSMEESPFVPYLSVNIGIVLALASLAVLIYFIHHISQSIQAENLIAEIGADFENALPHLFPEEIGNEKPGPESNPADAPDEREWKKARAVKTSVNGYLQRVDDERLMTLAREQNLLLQLPKRPGNFVSKNSPLVLVLSRDEISKELNEELCGQLRNCFSLGAHRTPHQDAEYSLQQLVEIASRALSPGVNEPFTAITCIDWLGTSLRGVANRSIPSPYRRDESGQLRVIARPLTFDALAHAALDPIRVFGANNPDIAAHLLRTIADLALQLHRDSDRKTLQRHAGEIERAASRLESESDRKRVSEQFQKTLQALAANDEETAILANPIRSE